MKHTKKLLISTLSVVALGAIVFFSQTGTNTTKAAQDSLYPVIGADASYERMYQNVDELSKAADLVALVKISNQEFLDQDPGNVQTRSIAEVKQVLKGNADQQTITITEAGGIADMSHVTGNEKRSVGNPQKQGKVEVVFSGSPVMKKGHTYLVFLKDTKEAEWGYSIVGSVQGKVRIDDSTNKGVITATHGLDGNMFFLQKQFAGKDKNEIVKSVSEHM